MAKERILIIEDERDILELLKYNLEKEGYTVYAVESGEEALKTARNVHPDLMLMDLMLPGIDGFEITRLLKNDDKMSEIPIIMLTAKGEESDIITGLELGAEDYITKPFSPKVVIARIRTVLRRERKNQPALPEVLRLHNIEIDPVRFEVLVAGQSVTMTATEFHILHFLIQHPGWVFTRSQIIDSVKGNDYPVTDRSVDVQIVGLRKKLGDAGHFIETVRGVGYRLKE